MIVARGRVGDLCHSCVVASADRNYRVQSVDRAIDVLELLAHAPDSLTVSQVAEHAGASKSAVFSTLQTLVARGLVLSIGAGVERRYQLGLRLAYFGDIARDRFSFSRLVRPSLDRITEKTGLTSRAAMWGGDCAIVVARVDGRGSVRFDMHMGQRELLHSSSVGKAMLSTMPDSEVMEALSHVTLEPRTGNTIVDTDQLIENLHYARNVGYAVDDEEDADGVICIGAPVTAGAGVGLAAISVTRIKADISTSTIHSLGSLVAAEASALEKRLSGLA